MTRMIAGFSLFAISIVLATQAASQSPLGKETLGKSGKKGPPVYELGKVLPHFIREEIDLSDEQEKQIDQLEREVKSRLSKILTDEQKRQIETHRPERKGKDFEGKSKRDARSKDDFPERPPLEKSSLPDPREDQKADRGLLANGRFERANADGTAPEGFVLAGNVRYGELGATRREVAGRGIRFISVGDTVRGGAARGSLTANVSGLRSADGRWFRFRIRGLAQEKFAVRDDALALKVEFYSSNGRNALDGTGRNIYPLIERERNDLRDAGHPLAREAWHSYALEFHTPFPEVDTLRLSVVFDKGQGQGERAEFWIGEMELTRIPPPPDYAPAVKAERKNAAILKELVPLGGRWYYDPRGDSPDPPRQFDHTNGERLLYRAGRFEMPFADNMSAWLRAGFLDRSGAVVKQDRFVPDNLVVSFTKTHLVMRSKNLPNHPTAVFPDRDRVIDGNPNSIQEANHTWHIPLEPKENPAHIAMDAQNSNRALPMGPIGVSVNGVVFFNPFDHLQGAEALTRLDRCCGHPGPGYDYHYHKYPVCVKTPWTDDGEDHSPLIGFAFDGLPIYGPYEKAGELAKDAKDNPLNSFNLHHDDERGWHYHVTPGRFPHIIGGYWGEVERRNIQQGKK